MAEPITSVKAVVALGEQLNNVLVVWKSMSKKMRRVFVCMIDSTYICTATFRSLQVILAEDELLAPNDVRIFTSAGLEQIETLAIKCDLVYKAAILMIQKAAERQISKTPAAAAGDNEDSPSDKETDYKTQIILRPVPDLSSTKILGLFGKLQDDETSRDWLENRLDHCAEQLMWIKCSLLVHLQIANHARLSQQSAVSFDDQLIGRTSILLLWNTYIKATKEQAREQEKAKRLEGIRMKKVKSDTASVKSSSTAKTVSTAVGSEAPNAVKLVDIADGTDVKTVPLPTPPPTVPTDPITTPGPTPASQLPNQTGPKSSSWMKNKLTQLKPFAPTSLPTNSNTVQGPPLAQLPPEEKHSSPTKPIGTKASKTIGTTLNNLGQNLSNKMEDLKHRVFGKDDDFKCDYESTELEAYIAYGLKTELPMKIPFGHRRLQYGLKRLAEDIDEKCFSTFNHYMAAGAHTQAIIDDVVREANRMQKCERTLLSTSVFCRPSDGRLVSLISFFSIQPEKPRVAFEDAIGRKYSLPFELCKKWKDMEVTIHEAFIEKGVLYNIQMPRLGPHVRAGLYDLVKNSTQEVILPGLWDSTIKPGDSISMKMWPPPIHPPQPSFQQPFVGYPRDSAAQRAKNERLCRVREFVCPLGPVACRWASCSSRNPQPFPHWMPPPMFPRPPPPPGGTRPVRIPAPSTISSSTSSSTENFDMTAEEKAQLTFVDYVEELEKAKTVTLTELLSKYTHLKDVTTGYLDDIDLDGYSSDVSTSTRSSSTGTIID